MGDMTKTITIKSDQLNSENLIGKEMVIKITKVETDKGDQQPCWIFFEGDNNKPYRPSLTMRKLLIMGWGEDSNLYIGRKLKLFRNPETKFGTDKVGGIEFREMSDINEPVIACLALTRNKKKTYIIKPLVDLKYLGEIEAKKGLDSLRRWFESLSKPEQIEASSFKDELKKIASDVVA